MKYSAPSSVVTNSHRPWTISSCAFCAAARSILGSPSVPSVNPPSWMNTLGAGVQTGAPGSPDQAGHGDRRTSVIGRVDLLGVRFVLRRFVYRVDQEVHRAAADQSVLGCEVLVQVVLPLLGSPASL